MEKQIASIPVDSGLLKIGDPCYENSEEQTTEQSYRTLCEVLKGHGFPLFFKTCSDQLAIQPGHGDGVYPVFANIVKGRIKSIEIKFF